ncbi:MAG: glycosyl transferase family 2 [Bacteroidetes bacterium RIFCSPLOWO2_12_FULL_35_15]|nr:MAG: glycosyl transferase family 2 [Bacteroidetes bacterium RIFCSPLOWO2_12_FULL_35_15]
MSTIEISIVIPVYNSSQIIEELYKRIAKAVTAGCTYEIIFVNDCSTDDSWQKISSLTERYPSISGINFRKNCGQDNALLAGLRIAKGNYCVIMDDDLQHDPEAILKLYNECKKGFDVCFANFIERKQNGVKTIGSNFNGKMAEFLLSKPKGIYLSPFKIITRSTVMEIAKFAGPYPYIDGIILTITQNLTQIEVEHQPRLSGKSNYTFSRSLSVFMKLFTGFSVAPLRIATITGFITTFIGFCLLLKYLYDFFITKIYVEGWTTVVVLIIIFGGMILTTLGIIGEYIGRMYLTLNNKPQYSITEIVRSKSNAQ